MLKKPRVGANTIRQILGLYILFSEKHSRETKLVTTVKKNRFVIKNINVYTTLSKHLNVEMKKASHTKQSLVAYKNKLNGW